MTEEEEMEASLVAFQKIVPILDSLPPERREPTVRAAMILVGTPIKANSTQSETP